MEEDDILSRYLLNGNPNIPYIYYTFFHAVNNMNLRKRSRVNSHPICLIHVSLERSKNWKT